MGKEPEADRMRPGIETDAKRLRVNAPARFLYRADRCGWGKPTNPSIALPNIPVRIRSIPGRHLCIRPKRLLWAPTGLKGCFYKG